MSDSLLEVSGLKKHFKVGGGILGGGRKVHAVDGVSFEIKRGETLSIVGESGCGKSTVARSVLGLTDITEGEIRLTGRRIDTLDARQLRPVRKRLQVVYQDPFSSLNPRMRVRDILEESLRNFGMATNSASIESELNRLMDVVKLSREGLSRYPHEFSGGQRQRIGIARALSSGPELIICDEAVSALDVSVKAQIVNLLQDLQKELGLSLLFISHDLAIVEHMTHRVAVMYLGKIVEIGTRAQIFLRAHHPYTQALMSAVPIPDPMISRRRIMLKGDVPSPISPPMGCHFHTRCPYAFERCKVERPELRQVEAGHLRACHLEELPQA